MKHLSLRKTDPPPAGKGKAQRSIFQKLAAVPHAFWTVLFIAAPMLFVLYFAFTDTEGNFSFSNIADLGQYTNVFILSIAFALIATAVCIIIGYPLAYFMSRQSPKAQKILMVLIMLPCGAICSSVPTPSWPCWTTAVSSTPCSGSWGWSLCPS